MKDLIKKERCDQHKLTMMVSPYFHFISGVLLLSSLMVTRTISIAYCPSLVILLIVFLEPFFNITFHGFHVDFMLDFDVEQLPLQVSQIKGNAM
jgi:hypothetical protein